MVKDIKGEEFGYLDVRVEPQRVYVHEPIRVRIEFGVDAGLRRSPTSCPAARHATSTRGAGAVALPSSTAPRTCCRSPEPKNGVHVVCNHTLQSAEYDADHQREGRSYQSFVFERAFLPTRIGTLELSAPMLRYDVMLRQGRVGIFGESVGAENKNYYVYGKPIRSRCCRSPRPGGRAVLRRRGPLHRRRRRLDKDTVKLPGSVKLTFTVRGQGNLEFLRVPDLHSLPGLHKLGRPRSAAPTACR